MTPGDGIRKLGFHRWYERQLIESHMYLVTGFISLVLVLACFETYSLRGPGFEPVLKVGLMLGGTVLCATSLHRYLFVLFRAERVAGQSVCGDCGSNGRLRVTSPPTAGDDLEPADIGVQCRQCGREWTVNCS